MNKRYILVTLRVTKRIWHSTIAFLLVIFSSTFQHCTKLVQIDPPANSITTSESFSDSTNASSAVLGIYGKLSNQSDGSIFFANGGMTLYCGMSSDELIPFSSAPSRREFYLNNLTPTNVNVTNVMWNSAYTYLYHINACIEGLETSQGLSQPLQKRLIAEAQFLRAFCYFYLVNIFGDVPYVASTMWEQTATSPRLSKIQIYQNITTDLLEAEGYLPDSYIEYGDERIRATKWAAKALLARIYLYNENWENADLTASDVINNSTFNLVNLSDVFLKNNGEAILQWQCLQTIPPYNATPEGINILPADHTLSPIYYLTENLLNSFEEGDKRRSLWVDSTVYNGTTYYYPFKYKVGPATSAPNQPITEYYNVLRLGELYLIRAEARFKQGNLIGAIGDINAIRRRAELPELSTSLTTSETIAAIAEERRIELFAEWGHRWFDLKRTNQADAVLGAIKASTWQTTDQLYPIPNLEITNNPNLTQNPGY